MKAIRVSEYGGPSVLKLEEVPAPRPGATQVLVRNHAVGVNPVDTYLRANADNRGPKLPYTPGSDSAGVVEAVGDAVTRAKKGDRVYVGGTLSGSYAELSLCEQTQVHALPGNVSYPQGAAMNVPYATAFHALFHRAHGEAGESVLVHGASGGVGIAAVHEQERRDPRGGAVPCDAGPARRHPRGARRRAAQRHAAPGHPPGAAARPGAARSRGGHGERPPQQDRASAVERAAEPGGHAHAGRSCVEGAAGPGAPVPSALA